jgi:hemerythrin-like domain-containing protein
MTPIEALLEEHRLILKALDLLEAAAGRLEAGDAVPDSWWRTLLDWLRGFADARHHAKEENVLFPAMVRCGAPERGGPIDVMLEEHVEGRALLAAMADGTPGHRASAARRYVRLLRDHIDKENGILFPFAEAIFDPATVVVVRREFETADEAADGTLTPALAEATLERLAAAREVASGTR